MIQFLAFVFLIAMMIFFIIPIMAMALPGILIIVGVWLLFRLLDKAASNPDKHDDTPRR